MIKLISYKLTAIVLAIILLSHNINTLVIVGNFIANQDFIAKTLCIQKDNQQGCNGKCQLKKQLAQNEPNSDSKTPLQESKRMVLDIYFITDISSVEFQDILFLNKKTEVFYKSPIPNERSILVDTPPPNYS